MLDGERIVSGLIGLACVVMLARLALGDARRAKWDRWFLLAWHGLRHRVTKLYRRQATRKEAEKATQEVLQRLMRQAVERDGNVITPKAFKRTGESKDRPGQQDG